ncbi:hypothetical protein ACFR97_00685 [Haloplanus litoreus]|uniref:DUF1102 domain-containing protein n=1 Tax=Haloplanus litoreus TaxID=767515 RepID=A0ABD5ZW21_9EURY
MDRRKFLVGLGSLAAGGAASIGTGATDVIQTNRSVSLDVAGDANAYLTLDPDVGSGSEFVETTSDGTISFDFSGSSTGAEGVNNNATTAARPAFRMENQSDSTLYTEVWNPFRNGNIDSQQQNTRGTSSVTMPAGLDFQFIAVKQGQSNSIGNGQAALIDRTPGGMEVPDNYNPSSGSFGDVPSNAYLIRDPSGQKSFAGWTVDLTKDDRIGHIELGSGEAVDVIVRLVADGVDLSSANIPTDGPVYIEAASDQNQMTFPEATGPSLV